MLAFAGPETLLVVVLVGLVVFGGSKIPELARSLGKAKGEFQKGLKEEEPADGAEAPAPAADASANPAAPAPAPTPAAPAPAASQEPATPAPAPETHEAQTS